MLQGQPWSAPACTRVLVRSPSGEYVTPKDAINSVTQAVHRWARTTLSLPLYELYYE